MNKSSVEIFTDGACSGNPGPGGWGVILRANGQEKELSGGEANTTNNRMELMAAIKALEALTRPCAGELYTDSSYVQKGCHGMDERMESQGLARTHQKSGFVVRARSAFAKAQYYLSLDPRS